jgi:hypothetical protein
MGAVGLGTGVGSAATVPTAPSQVKAMGQGLTAVVSWLDGETAGVSGYTVSASPQLAAVEVPAGAASAVLTGLRPGVAYKVSVAARTASGTGAAVPAAGSVQAKAPGGVYTGLRPARLLDTRTGVGAAKRAASTVSFAVGGHGGVPRSGVGAVALNVTVYTPSGGGYLTACPAGRARPAVWSAAYTAHLTTATLVVAQLGSGGKVTLHASGKAQLSADVVGYYSTAAVASAASRSGKGLFEPVAPARILDTRSSLGGKAPGAGGTLTLQVAGRGGIPTKGVAAVVLDTTATSPTAAGSATVYPTGQTRPGPYSLDFAKGQTVTNRVVVPLGKGGKVSLYNRTGRVQLLADVTGWYTDGSDSTQAGSYYVPVAPRRLVDTRTGTGAPKHAVAAGAVLPVQVAARAGVPSAQGQMPPTAAALTVTAVAPGHGGTATVYPSLTTRPATTDLTLAAKRSSAGLALTGLGVDGAVDLYNTGGATQYAVDVSGYFLGGTVVPSSTVTPAAGAIAAVSGTPGGEQSVTLTQGQQPPKIGQVLAAAPTATVPLGLLAQVTGLGTDATGRTVVQTAPATLQQALGDARIDVSAPLGAADVVTVQSGGQNVRPVTTAARTGADAPALTTPALTTPALTAQTLEARTVSPADAGGPVTGSSGEPCSGDNTSYVNVTHSITPTLYFQADLGHRGLLPTLSATTGAQLTETLGAAVQFGGTVHCQWDTVLDTYTFRPVTFVVGGVPVVIVPVFTLTLKADLSGTASVSTSVTQKLTADAGLSFDSGTGATSAHSSVSNSLTHTGPTVSPAKGAASVQLIGDLEGRLYGVAGPDIALTAQLIGTVDPSKTPWWQLRFTLGATAELHMQVLFAHLDAEISFPLVDTVVAQATGSAPVVRTFKLTPVLVSTPQRTSPPAATATVDCRGITALDVDTTGEAVDSMWLSVNSGPWVGYSYQTKHIALAEVKGTVELDVLPYGGDDGETDDWRFTEVYSTPGGC